MRTRVESPILTQEIDTSLVSSGDAYKIRVGVKIKEAERRLILATFEHCSGSKERIAEMLGVSVKTLYNRLREYGVQ